MKNEKLYRELFRKAKDDKMSLQDYLDFLDDKFPAWKKLASGLPPHIDDFLRKSKTEDEFIKVISKEGLDESFSKVNLKEYFQRRISEEDKEEPDKATLISIVKNPYQGKYVAEYSYDDAVKILKDKYGFTDEAIEDIKKSVAVAENVHAENEFEEFMDILFANDIAPINKPIFKGYTGSLDYSKNKEDANKARKYWEDFQNKQKLSDLFIEIFTNETERKKYKF